MANWTDFNSLGLELGKGTHDFATGTLNVMLTNTAPASSNTTAADITEIAAGSGYTAGGAALPGVTWTTSGGTATLSFGPALVFTAAGGAIADFRYAVLYNASNDALIAYWDNGAVISLGDGDSFTLNAADILTLG